MAGRGQRQDDARLFVDAQVAVLRAAAGELAWLLDRGYTRDASLKLVGDRHALVARQREALARAVCTPTQATTRSAARLDSVAGQALWIDGFNVLITIEAALAGGVLVRGLDGAVRDMASVHGSYRRVDQTHAALAEILGALKAAAPNEVHWYFDRPVSNSGRAAQWVRELDAAGQGPWTAWEAECVDNPDRTLIESGVCVASSDAWVLDSAAHSFDLVGTTLDSSRKLAHAVARGPAKRGGAVNAPRVLIALGLLLALSCHDEDQASPAPQAAPAAHEAPPANNVGTMLELQPAAWGNEPVLRPSPWQWLRVWYAYWLLPIPNPLGADEGSEHTNLGAPPADGFDHTSLGKDVDCRDCHDVPETPTPATGSISGQ